VTSPAPLHELLRRLCLTGADDAPVRALIGADAGPRFREVERYAVVPNVRRAAFLVPLGGRRRSWASLHHYNALRPPGTAIRREVVALGVAAGVLPVGRNVVRIFLDRRVPDADAGQHLITRHLADVLGAPGVAAAVGVRREDPNHKPTLQLFDPAGSPVGFAKVGWSEATRRLVEAEEFALGHPAVRGLARVGVPELLHAGSWGDRRLTVIAPLPLTVRRLPVGSPPPLGLAEDGTDALGPTPLADSPYWHRGRTQLQEEVAHLADLELARVLTHYAESLERRYGRVPLQWRPWHGDWVPWNLGRSDGRLFAWDWEHFAAEVPRGLDLAHWHFQSAFILAGQSFHDAVRSMEKAAPEFLHPLGASPHAVRSTVAVYLLELALRTCRLRRGGGGWNARIYPDIVAALTQRSGG
jgi:hypothetical protein